MPEPESVPVEPAEAPAAPIGESVPSVPAPIADARLVAAHDLALSALHEITASETVGAPAGHRVEADGVVSLLFENAMPGYPGWYWTVSLAVVDGEEPTVLEAELLPGDDALLAPEWVPWSVRLKEYQAHQKALAEAEATASEVEDADDQDDDESDDDFDADGSSILHSGDVDGVDIDELDEEAPDDEDE